MLPASVAVNPQVPTAINVTVNGPVPLTVQIFVVVEVSVTARSLDAVGVSVSGPAFYRTFGGGVKVMVCICRAAAHCAYNTVLALIPNVPPVA